MKYFEVLFDKYAVSREIFVDIVKDMKTAYCVDNKQNPAITEEYPRLAHHSLEVLNAFTGQTSLYWAASGFFSSPELTTAANTMTADMEDMSIEKFCGLSSPDLKRIYDITL